ncbi:hypothetical protein Verru16b_00824 [Lacunisphaera limnophila]|uniref:PEP-CTERM protein-sorting domain-containing protein n=1 Tax=Lacunisphaera limnophila TaxID=1838286 RepID=A0A1D8ASA3_9BACT|nr:hypothetical protein [Lacunisphaera limnophila]AOS43767.1 hypothetical protein Verru16b_00824 [Lacunisphaera limnophila]
MPSLPTQWSLLRLLAGLPLSVMAQTTLVSYTFEGTTIPVVGSSLSTVTWNSGGLTGYASPFSSQGQALSVGNFQVSEYYQFTLNATGYGNLVLNPFRANGSGTAPLNWRIATSLAGLDGPFAEAATFTLAANSAVDSTTIPGLELGAGADNNASIVLRLIATSSTRIDGNPAAASGTFRLDNISFTGTAIPEPATYAVFLSLVALLYRHWYRRRPGPARSRWP